MIGYLVLLAATLLAMELAWATSVLASFAALSAQGGRVRRVLARRGVSEWAKERAMRLLSGLLLRRSLGSAGLLAVVASPVLIAMAVEAVWPFGLHSAYANWSGRTVVLALSLAYLVLRRKARRAPAAGLADGAAPAPGAAERLWHRVALGNHAVLAMSFEIERSRFQPWQDTPLEAGQNAPIFIAGLARSGTTILTRHLHERHSFASLTYRDLPFPLAPNSWGALSDRLGRWVARVERGHGDGIEHDLDSAEAIEEVFWRHHEGARYVASQGLLPVEPLPDTISAFRDYVGLVRRRYGGARYLSKNNANVLRLPALIAAFPQGLIVHPFRDPLQQAQSLLRQHRQALHLAGQDPFRRDFMRWLGHHEFGADQRPFCFPGHPRMEASRDHIDYWLRLWVCVHNALLAQDRAVSRRQVFLDYDALCADPARHAVPLGIALGLEWPLATQGLAVVPRRAVTGADPALVDKARALHLRLRARSGAIVPAAGHAA